MVFVCWWVFVCFPVTLGLVSRVLFLWVVGVLPELFTHTDIEIIAVVAPCYLLQPCVSACVCAAPSLEETMKFSPS